MTIYAILVYIGGKLEKEKIIELFNFSLVGMAQKIGLKILPSMLEFAKQFSLDEKEISILIILCYREDLIQQDICEITKIDRNTMVKIIDNLEQKSYVRRRQNPENRRQNLVYITNIGIEVTEKIVKNVTFLEEEYLTARLTNDEMISLKKIIKKI